MRTNLATNARYSSIKAPRPIRPIRPIMLRCALLALTSVIIRVAKPEFLRLGSKLDLSSNQLTTIYWYLKWALPLWAIVDLNSGLNRWAERRWIWKTDKSAWDWKHEIAVVTGGSAGIGAYVVKRLASHGIRVAVLDVNPLSDVFNKEELALVQFYQCDITSRESIHQAAETIRSDLGPPSILINNAGIGNAWTILDIPEENLKRMLDINLMSHWSTVQEFLPDMLAKKKGHIMSVASLASFVALANAVDYSCTKAALLAFHEGLTQELKHRYKCPQIQTSIVHPNWTKSAITSHSSIQTGLRSVGAKILEPEHVAQAMVDQIIAVKSGQLILGPAMAPKFRALPLWLQEIVRDSQANIVSGNGSTAGG
ncbi:dehydrogenase reductase sdr family member 8 precursor [Pyrenophora seminiperda CCB06]|uniref:Short-chain dehydrogenase/reductase 3 n=1 Tax=Pyrenophora seminiperda CCB06 TaxID=1302712 RepID=A0A3M7MH79_9PLEO|nr:dehydrogenase reductase sdr family member 8 precursor [Pyrenophora seminiperda CCB06]